MGLRVGQFLAILFTALALAPSGTHLFELPNKGGTIGPASVHWLIVPPRGGM